MPLTRDQVVEAALTVAGDYGLGDLSMRRVAAELGVHAGALYWHVANKQQLLIAVAQRILDPDDGAASWPQEPVEVLTEFRRRLLAVRDGAEIVAVAHADQPLHLPPAADLAAMLDSSGVRDPAAAAQNLIRWVLGSVLTQQTAQALAAAETHGQSLATAVADRFEREFHLGLELLVDLAPPRV